MSPAQDSVLGRTTRYGVMEHLGAAATYHSPYQVCKTCSDYKHVCLGYSESSAHLRSQSDSASRAPQIPPFGPNDSPPQRNERAVESCSPEPTPTLGTRPALKATFDKSPVPKKSDSKETTSSRDASARPHKESTSQVDGDSPESSESDLPSDIS